MSLISRRAGRCFGIVAMFGMALVLVGCGSDEPTSIQGESSTSLENATTTSEEAPTTSAEGGANDAAGNQHYLWVQPLLSHPVHQIMQAGFEAECDAAGVTCTRVGTPQEADIPGTIALAEAALAQGDVTGVAVYAYDPAFYPFIEQLAAVGLPVVSWHIPVPEGDADGLLAIAGTDPTAYAMEAAAAIGEEMGGEGTVAITQGSFNTTENIVAEVFAEEMTELYPDITVLPPEEEGFDLPQAISKATAILQANTDVTAAFSTTGGGPQTWAGAADQSGRELTIIGMDYTRQNLDLVAAGDVYAVVGQPLFEESAEMVRLLNAIISGDNYAYDNPLKAPIITQDMVDLYYEIVDKADALR